MENINNNILNIKTDIKRIYIKYIYVSGFRLVHF